MSVSPGCRVFSPLKHSVAVRAALEKKSDSSKFRVFCKEGFFWTVASVILLLEVLVFRGWILRLLAALVYPLEKGTAYLIEAPLLIVAAVNTITCLFVAFKSAYYCKKSAPGLGLERSRLLGLDAQEQGVLPDAAQTLTRFQQGDKAKSSRQFSFQWLSALRFGSLRNAFRSRSRAPVPYDSFSASGNMSAERESSFLKSPSSSPTVASTLRSNRSFRGESDASLAAEVGSRTSPYSKPTTSVQTSKQLEKLLENNSVLDSSTIGSVSAAGLSASFGSSYGGRRRSGFGNQYPLLTSGSPAYELGTSFTEDDQSKNVNDENGVIALVTGSRIKVTSNRISLSPIPLNLLKAAADITNSSDSATNAEKGSSSRTVDNKNNDNDSTSFRIMLNAAKRSPRKPSGTRRSDSWERRRAISVSPVSSTSASPFAAAFASAESSSPNTLAKQMSLSSAEILNQYKMDAEQFMVSERLLRAWIRETIVQPLVLNVERMNEVLSKDYSVLHLKIGRSTVHALANGMSAKPDLFSTPLPYILPYLKAHDKQSYIVKRARALSTDICMTDYNWQSGGGEPIEKQTDGDNSYTPAEGPWGEHLPTDAQLIWSWFCAYFDARMAANPLASDLQTPFSSVYFLKKPSKPSAVQCAPDSFYIHQVSIHPPQFELVVEGGRERFEMSRGSKNLWRTILLFLQHARLFNNNRIGELVVDETGINIAHILE